MAKKSQSKFVIKCKVIPYKRHSTISLLNIETQEEEELEVIKNIILEERLLYWARSCGLHEIRLYGNYPWFSPLKEKLIHRALSEYHRKIEVKIINE